MGGSSQSSAARDIYFDNLYLRLGNACHISYGFADAEFLRRGVIFYIGNSNCRDSLVMGYAKTVVGDRMVKLFRSKIQKLNIYIGAVRNYPLIF